MLFTDWAWVEYQAARQSRPQYPLDSSLGGLRNDLALCAWPLENFFFFCRRQSSNLYPYCYNYQPGHQISLQQSSVLTFLNTGMNYWSESCRDGKKEKKHTLPFSSFSFLSFSFLSANFLSVENQTTTSRASENKFSTFKLSVSVNSGRQSIAFGGQNTTGKIDIHPAVCT